MEQTHASEAGLSDSALYRDASMAKLEMFLEKAKLLVEERTSLGSSTTDKRRKAAIDEELPDIRANIEALRLCIDGTGWPSEAGVRDAAAWKPPSSGCISSGALAVSARALSVSCQAAQARSRRPTPHRSTIWDHPSTPLEPRQQRLRIYFGLPAGRACVPSSVFFFVFV